MLKRASEIAAELSGNDLALRTKEIAEAEAAAASEKYVQEKLALDSLLAPEYNKQLTANK